MAAMGLFRKLIDGAVARTNPDVPVITGPRLGFLNLMGEAGAPLLSRDRRALAPLFSSVAMSHDEPPQCDVLFIYCRIDASGRVAGSAAGLRGIIRAARAPVVVVASENEMEGYTKAATPDPDARANLVMTLDRDGEIFPRFFARLFGRMLAGTSMPVAWVELAPQGGGDQPDTPGTIFACEAGQLAFRAEA
jgi:hypothetical protein